MHPHPNPRPAPPWPWLGDAQATAARRGALWRLLGTAPVDAAAVSGRLLRTDADGMQHWQLDLDADEPVPALLRRPPAGMPLRGLVLYCHAHGRRFEMGADELAAGRPALQSPPYGPVLAARGWAALAIDQRGFGARQGPGEPALVKHALWHGRTLWGLRLRDTLAALDWLRAQPAFATLPVVTLGLSMGSTLALWAAALDDRIAGCAELCCAAEYDALLASGGYDGHGEYFFVPGLLSAGFTLGEISALIAPRPHLSLAGRADPLTPPAGLDALDRTQRAAYAALGAPAAWQQHLEDVGHTETPAMRARVLEWLAARAA
jgi:dienelactone hydrolase